MSTKESQLTKQVIITVTINRDVCHNGDCENRRDENVLGPYCSWVCRNESKWYEN